MYDNDNNKLLMCFDTERESETVTLARLHETGGICCLVVPPYCNAQLSEVIHFN